MDKSTHEEHLSQPLQTNNKHFKIAVIFLTGYNSFFNNTNSSIKPFFMRSFTDGDFIQIIIPHGAYEVESLKNEIKRIIIDKGYYSENNYPFQIKPNFSTLGSIIEILAERPIFSFVFNGSIRSLLGFEEGIIWREYKLSPNPVDILSFDNIFLEGDIVQGMIFKSFVVEKNNGV